MPIVDFVGIWDTVGSLAFGQTVNSFHELSPSNVSVVCHALALDERRASFSPTLWERQAGSTTAVHEVWFAGAHSNVGGGYGDKDLSNAALFWVLMKAREAGLACNLEEVQGWFYEKVDGPRNSYREFVTTVAEVTGFLAPLLVGVQARNLPSGARVHASVFDALEETGYRPWSLYRGGDVPVFSLDALAIEPWGD